MSNYKQFEIDKNCNKMNWSQYEVNKFFDKITFPGNETECWNWNASKDRDGYGDFRIGKTYRAHRLIYEYYFGPIPKDLKVCHKCDNTSCCNPNHLFLGTNKDNMLDMKQKDRAAKGSNQGTSIFTEKDIENIILDSYNYKYMSLSEISRKYSTSVTIIWNIFNGSFWSHTTDPILTQLNITRDDLKKRVTRFHGGNYKNN